MTDRINPRLKTTPSEPSDSPYTLQESAIQLNTKTFRFEHSEIEILSKAYITKPRTKQPIRPMKANRTAIVESLSEKHLGDREGKQTSNKYYYSTANLDVSEVEGDNDVVGLLREKCSKYEKTIGELYQHKEEQSKDLLDAQQEVNRLKNLYESKLGEVNSVSCEITNRIEKEQAEKNLFIKEINNRNIEINRLREATSILKAENETLNLVLRQKQAEIEQLEQTLEEGDEHRRKLESYELAVSDSNSLLRDIEEQTKQRERESSVKDKVIEELQSSVSGFLDKMKIYEQKILELEQASNTSEQQRCKWKESCSYAQAQAQQWKQSYIDTSRQLEQLPQLQIKLKNTILTNGDLQARIQELLESQQLLKLQVNSQNLRDKKLAELESTIQSLQRSLKEKEQQLGNAHDQVSKLNWQLREINTAQERIGELEKYIDEQSREFKTLERKIQEKTIICNSYEREVRRVTQQNDKIKERNEKIDHVFKENKRLTTSLMDKINEIERLQHTVNTLQSRVATLSNQVLKLNALYEQSNDATSELTSTIQTTQMRLQCQISLKFQLQQKVDRITSESAILTKNLNKQREMSRVGNAERQTLRRDLHEAQLELEAETSAHQRYRAESQMQFTQERRKVEEMTSQIGGIKKRIEQMQRREKEQSDSIISLESDKRSMLSEFSTLRTNYEQAVSRLNVLDKWKAGYMSFMMSINRTTQDMQQTSEQLLA